MKDINAITPTARANLYKLAKGIALDNKFQFSMDCYRRIRRTSHSILGSNTKVEGADIHSCGTTACMLGYAPYIKGLEIIGDDMDSYYNQALPSRYSRRLFNLDPNSPTWEFIFSGSWFTIDNTRLGGVKRIIYCLEQSSSANIRMYEDYARLYPIYNTYIPKFKKHQALLDIFKPQE